MSIHPSRFAIAGVFLLTSIGLASSQSSTSTSNDGQSSDFWTQLRVQWNNPYVIDARPTQRGAFVSGGEYYSTFKGRKMQMSEIMAGLSVTDKVSLFYGRQKFHLEGRSQSSRFNLSDDIYGGKWVVSAPDEDHDYAIAIEFQVVRPGTATATSGNATETFAGIQNNTVAVDFGGNKGIQYQIEYTDLKSTGIGKASIYSGGLGWDRDLSKRAQLRLQAQLMAQHYQNLIERKNLELKPIFYAAVGYDANKIVRFEADGTLFPAGIPLASGMYTGLSSFEIYSPGGVAGEIKNSIVGFVAARVLFHWNF